MPKVEATPRKISDSQATETTEYLLAHHLLQMFVPDGTSAVVSSSTRLLAKLIDPGPVVAGYASKLRDDARISCHPLPESTGPAARPLPAVNAPRSLAVA